MKRCTVVEDGVPCNSERGVRNTPIGIICGKHRQRWLRHGDVLYINPKKTYGSARHRFETKIVTKTAGPDGDCWHTSISVKGRDRPMLRDDAGKMRPAAQVVYEIYNGPLDEGLEVCHSCCDKLCLNPAHLFLDTHYANMHHADSIGTALWNCDVPRCIVDDVVRRYNEGPRGSRWQKGVTCRSLSEELAAIGYVHCSPHTVHNWIAETRRRHHA